MGRRSRKRAALPPDRRRAAASTRTASDPAEDGPARSERSPSRRPRRDERPPAPWGGFPLVELCILIALVIGVAGFITGGHRGFMMLAAAAALGSLGGLELSIREHFAGYRSHSTLLAGAAAVAVLAILFFARVPRGIELVGGAVVFGTAFYALREVFKGRSGGHGFR